MAGGTAGGRRQGILFMKISARAPVTGGGGKPTGICRVREDLSSSLGGFKNFRLIIIENKDGPEGPLNN